MLADNETKSRGQKEISVDKVCITEKCAITKITFYG